jgi:hypothetical protein
MPFLAGLVGLDPTGPSVELDLPPPPEAGVGWLQPLAVLVLLLSVVVVLRRRRRLRKLGIGGLRSFALGAAVGNVLMDIGALLMPNRPAAVSIQRIEEDVDVDDAGDGRDPPLRPAGASAPGRAREGGPQAFHVGDERVEHGAGPPG